MRVAAIVLAAGESKRMGRDKALLPWPAGSSSTLVQMLVETASAVAQTCFVVAGWNHDRLAEALQARPVQVVRNEVPELGMFSSLRCGVVAALDDGAEGAFVFHVDRPPVRVETLRLMMQSLEEEVSESPTAIVASYRGRHGHPYMVSAGMMREMVAASAEANARDLMHERGSVRYVECDDPAVVLNLNTQAEYERAAGLTGVEQS